ncbi:MAG: hypothetical protein WCS51_05800 [Bacilli bacterium]
MNDFNLETTKNYIYRNARPVDMVWWKFNKTNDLYEYNPTAYFVDLIIKCANKNTPFYQKGVEIIKEAFEYLKMHIVHPILSITSMVSTSSY